MDKYPWLVSIWGVPRVSTTIFFFCGGTLVASKYVISAAHCMDLSWIDYDKGLSVLVGDFDHSQVQETNFVNVKTITNHPKWVRCKNLLSLLQQSDNPRTDLCVGLGNDVAVLELEEAVDLETHPPACLPFAGGHTSYDGKLATLAGWGLLEDWVSLPDPKPPPARPPVPHEVTVPVLAACKWASAGPLGLLPVPSSVLCTGAVEAGGGKSGCNVILILNI